MTLSFAGQNHKWNTAEDAAPVVEAITKQNELKCLKLEANTLGIEAAKVIGDALAGHPEFERAHWKDLFTGRLKTEIPQALKHLFSGLMRAGAHLKELDLSDNALGPVGVEGMIEFMSSPVCYSLEELRLNNNGLGIKGGTMLCNSLKKLVENAKADGTALKLKVFISGRNRLEKEGAKVFSELFASIGTLEEVAMPQNGIFHEGIAALAVALRKNPNLRILNLNDNTFTPKGARAMADQLKHMQNLEVIDFGDCLTKTAGAKCLAEAIKDGHPKLTHLNLESNEILVEGGLAIVDAMKNKDNLEFLHLDTNQFGEDGADRIVEFMTQIGKETKLKKFEDNDEPDSDNEEEEGEDDEDEDSESEDESSGNESEVEGIPATEKKLEEEDEERLPLLEYYKCPTLKNLLASTNYSSKELRQATRDIVNDESPEAIINSCFNLLAKSAQFYNPNDETIKRASLGACCDLATIAFEFAKDYNLGSVASNALLVNLGLIKSEDKKFKVEWDVKNVLNVLPVIIPQPYFPKETKDCLQSFLQKANTQVETCHKERHQIMKSMYV